MPIMVVSLRRTWSCQKRLLDYALDIVGGSIYDKANTVAQEFSLFRRAALSLRVVSQDGDSWEELCLPGCGAVPIPPGAGNNSLFTSPSTSVVQPGKRSCTMVASFAGSESTTCASPR